MLNISVTLMVILSVIFLFSKTPHVLILNLLVMTTTAAIIVGSIKSFPWFAYILFMAFLGGILVLFTYISSLSSNLLFAKVNLSQFIFISPIIIFIISNSSNFSPSSELMYLSSSMLSASMYLVNELFSPLTSLLYSYLFIYLLLTLIYIVSMMKTYSAPLRFLGKS